jgi:hypothetical protein
MLAGSRSSDVKLILAGVLFVRVCEPALETKAVGKVSDQEFSKGIVAPYEFGTISTSSTKNQDGPVVAA